MKRFSIGIDMAKLTFVVAIKVNDKYQSKLFDNNEDGFKASLNWLKQYSAGEYHFCMESTGKYGDALATFLHKNNAAVSIVNPAKIKYFMKSQLSRNKTDSIDAKLICDYCKLFNPSQWQPLAVEVRELQSLVKRLDTLNNIFLQEQNRLENVDEIIKESIDDNMTHLKKEIKKIEKKIKEHIDKNPAFKEKSDLLKSIPGIGEKTISKILAFLSHIENFDNAKKVVAFIGLNPQHAQSGTSLNYSHLSKTGNAQLRKMFYMPALVTIQYESSLGEFYRKLVSKGKPKKSAICAVMRKLVHIIYGILKSKKKFDRNLVCCQV